MNPFKKPTLREILVRQLDEARIALVQAEEARDYATSMVSYNETKIARLEKNLAQDPAKS
jgi:hypothetical protein